MVKLIGVTAALTLGALLLVPFVKGFAGTKGIIR